MTWNYPSKEWQVEKKELRIFCIKGGRIPVRWSFLFWANHTSENTFDKKLPLIDETQIYFLRVYTLSHEAGFPLWQKNLLPNQRSERNTFASWLNRKMKIQKFCDSSSVSQKVGISHFWACAERHLSVRSVNQKLWGESGFISKGVYRATLENGHPGIPINVKHKN